MKKLSKSSEIRLPRDRVESRLRVIESAVTFACYVASREFLARASFRSSPEQKPANTTPQEDLFYQTTEVPNNTQPTPTDLIDEVVTEETLADAPSLISDPNPMSLSNIRDHINGLYSEDEAA